MARGTPQSCIRVVLWLYLLFENFKQCNGVETGMLNDTLSKYAVLNKMELNNLICISMFEIALFIYISLIFLIFQFQIFQCRPNFENIDFKKKHYKRLAFSKDIPV